MTHLVSKKARAIAMSMVALTAAVPLASAAPRVTFASGSGVLTLSNCDESFCYDGADPTTVGGMVLALNAISVNLSGIGGATVSQGLQDPADLPSRYAASVRTHVTDVTLSEEGDVLGVQFEGGMELLATRNPTLTGGSAKVTNLRFDLTRKTIYADLDGLRSALGTRPAASFTLGDQALWTYESMSGPTGISPIAYGAADPVAALTAAGFTVTRGFDAGGSAYFQLTANNTISGLKITPEGFNFFKDSLGLTNAGISALRAVTDYGVVNYTLNFRPASIVGTSVPEPTAMSLILLGLIGMGAMAKRRGQIHAA